MEGHPVILAVQDTTSVNYDSQQKMEGLGYINGKTIGVNIHTCLAVTPEGLVLGALDQTGYNRKKPKNTTLTKEQQKNRPINGKRKQPMAHYDGAGEAWYTGNGADDTRVRA
jgi:hypothetical protein